MSTSRRTGSSGGWGNTLATLLSGIFCVAIVWFAAFVVATLDGRDISLNTEPQPVRTHGPDRRECFEENAGPLWDCITYKDD